jgi:cyclic pyranopterin monophosphate synthase
MVNITHKQPTLRIAIAEAVVVVSKSETIAAIEQKTVPKGDVLECARVAGLFAAKKTSELIPDCHPLPIEYTHISFRIEGLSIFINVEIHTIYKTGVEVEAMHAASVVALTMYDMLKPLDKAIAIQNIRLLDKKGGKSDIKTDKYAALRVGVIVCSDTASAGQKQDVSGKKIIEKLQKWGLTTEHYKIVSDDILQIQTQVIDLYQQRLDLVLLTGGTGISPRDQTPEAIRPLLDKTLNGVEETIRAYGQQRTPYAMLSRACVGLKGEMLVIALAGSVKAVEQGVDAIFPQILHVFDVLNNQSH